MLRTKARSKGAPVLALILGQALGAIGQHGAPLPRPHERVDEAGPAVMELSFRPYDTVQPGGSHADVLQHESRRPPRGGRHARPAVAPPRARPGRSAAE